MERHIKDKIKKGSLKEAFTIVNGMLDTSGVLIPVIHRNHIGLFTLTLSRAQNIPQRCIRYLLDKPEMLKMALAKGLDPNKCIDGITPLELAAKKHKYSAVKVLLSLDNMVVSRYVIGKIRDQADLYMLALRHAEAKKLDVIHALQIRSTPLLQLCLHKLSTPNIADLSLSDETEKKEDHSEWAAKVSELLQCPILLRPTGEPVKTPSGHIFDHQSILGWITTNSSNPMTREPLQREDLLSVGATVLGPELLEGL